MKENETKQTESSRTVTLEMSELLELCRNASLDNSQTNQDRKQSVNPSDNQINFLEIAKVLLKKWWIIALVTILVATAVFGYFYSRLTVTYYATAKMFVNNNNISVGQSSLGGISFNQIGLASNLISTYCEILKTRKTLNAVNRRLYENYGYEMSYYELLNMIGSGSVDGTVVFFIQTHHSDPEIAVNVVNTIVEVLPAQIESIVDGASAKVVDFAEDAVGYSSDVKKKTVFAAAVAFILTCLVIIFKDYVFNDTISSSDWISQAYSDLPILAEIPDVNSESKDKRYYKYYYYQSDKKKNDTNRGNFK